MFLFMRYAAAHLLSLYPFITDARNQIGTQFLIYKTNSTLHFMIYSVLPLDFNQLASYEFSGLFSTKP